MRILNTACKLLLVCPLFSYAGPQSPPDLNEHGLPICQNYLSDSAEFDMETLTLKGGFKPAFQARLKTEIENLRLSEERAKENFVNVTGMTHAIYLNDMIKGNMMITGPGGGAKTNLITWLHAWDLWKLQCRETMSDKDIFGAETEEGLKAGSGKINRQGKIGSKKFAMIDEIANCSAQALAALLQVLNPTERSTQNELGETIRFDYLRSVYATGNATIEEMLEAFENESMRSGKAFMNRILIKGYMSKWSNEYLRKRFDSIKTETNRLKTIALGGSDEQSRIAKQRLKKTEAPAIDFDVLEFAANSLFVGTSDYHAALRELEEQLMKEYNKVARESERQYRQSGGIGEFKARTIPPAEFTLRLKEFLDPIVRYSAALDYFLYADMDEILSRKRPIELGPLSIWRTHWLLTFVRSGEAPELNPQDFKVHFNLEVFKNDPQSPGKLREQPLEDAQAQAQTESEAQVVKFIYEIQSIFNDVFSNIMKVHQSETKDIASILAAAGDEEIVSQTGSSYELWVWEKRREQNLTFKQRQ